MKNIHRIHVIHDLLASRVGADERILHKDLVAEVRRRLGTQVSAKTIQRDLIKMRDELGLPIIFDRHANTFRYSQPATMRPVPISALSNLDVRALAAGRQAVSLFQGTPWHDGLRLIFDRLLNASPKNTVNACRELFSKIRFAGPLPQPVDAALWTQVLQALDEEKTLKITYRTGRDGIERERKMDPYGLVIAEQQWQLIAWDHSARDIRTFLLQRIAKWELTDDFLKTRNNFTLDDYLKNAIAGQQSIGEPVLVRLRFTKEGTPAGEAAVWHPDEKRSYDEQGSLVVEFSTAALFKVEREVLAWGGHCEVLKPDALREKVCTSARFICDAHGESR